MSCEELIRQEIDRTGPINFARFVELALYHPKYGYYYQTAPRRGKAGDYFTSLQVSDLFPRIFANVIRQLRDALGTDSVSLIEVGAGDGEFLEGVLKNVESNSLRVWAVERSASARDKLHKRLSRFPKCEVVSSFDDIEWM